MDLYTTDEKDAGVSTRKNAHVNYK